MQSDFDKKLSHLNRGASGVKGASSMVFSDWSLRATSDGVNSATPLNRVEKIIGCLQAFIGIYRHLEAFTGTL